MIKLREGMEQEYAKYVETNSADAYSHRVVTYGEDWANLMDERITDERPLAEVAQGASSEADTDGITGYMYGAAVSALGHFWHRGDDLRKWHNRQYITDETKADEASDAGKIVNPAILTIG